MICPIRFIRKPEESECIREKCGFWVDGYYFTESSEERQRFSALLGMNKAEDMHSEQAEDNKGKCSILAIAETLLKSQQKE